MALCALHVAQSSNMLSVTIKYTTTTLYLKMASSFPLNNKHIGPLLDMRVLEVQHIKDVLSEVKIW